MKITNYTNEELTAMKSAIQYWIAHWDWECPTLFGLDKSDFIRILESWPLILNATEDVAVLVAEGSFRELLHGASAIKPKAKVFDICGISFDKAETLLCRLSEQAKEGNRTR